MAGIYPNDAGALRTVRAVYANDGGTLRNIVAGYINDAGVLRKFWSGAAFTRLAGSGGGVIGFTDAAGPFAIDAGTLTPNNNLEPFQIVSLARAPVSGVNYFDLFGSPIPPNTDATFKELQLTGL